MSRSKFIIAAAAMATAFASPVFAQQSGTPASSDKAVSVGSTQMGNTGVGGSGGFSGWLSDYQTKNQGRVSRQAYMDEVGRRWDMADRDKRGLTQDQINEAYGMSGPGMTSTSPGNMGPNNVKK